MPYSSDAQRRYFHAAEARGEMPKKTVDEFDQASKGKDLPEHVKKMAEGGHVCMACGGPVEPDGKSMHGFMSRDPDGDQDGDLDGSSKKMSYGKEHGMDERRASFHGAIMKGRKHA